MVSLLACAGCPPPLQRTMVQALLVLFIGMFPALAQMIILTLSDNFDASIWSFFHFIWTVALLYTIIWKRKPRRVKTLAVKILKSSPSAIGALCAFISFICSLVKGNSTAAFTCLFAMMSSLLMLAARYRRHGIQATQIRSGFSQLGTSSKPPSLRFESRRPQSVGSKSMLILPDKLDASVLLSEDQLPDSQISLETHNDKLSQMSTTDAINDHGGVFAGGDDEFDDEEGYGPRPQDYQTLGDASESVETWDDVEKRRKRLESCDTAFSVLRGICEFVLVFLLLGAAIQSIMSAQEYAQYPSTLLLRHTDHPPWAPKLNFVCVGRPANVSSNGTLILEAGLPYTSVAWSNVISLAQGRFPGFSICSYDRMNYGWSGHMPIPRTASKIAEELNSALHFGGFRPPFIMCGWSFGSFISHVFRSTFANETAGMVLVDPTYPALMQNTTFTAELKSSLIAFNFYRMATPLAIPRIANAFGLLPSEVGLANNNLTGWAQGKTNAYLFRQNFGTGALYELMSFNVSAYEAHDATYDPPLRDLPISVVISSEAASDAAFNAYVSELQHISHNIRLFNSTSDHFVPYNDPNTILNAIASVIARIQTT